VSITIQAASIDTSEPSRDAHLRSADFFAVDEFATLTAEVPNYRAFMLPVAVRAKVSPRAGSVGN